MVTAAFRFQACITRTYVAAKCVEKSGAQPHTGLMTMWSSR